MKWKVSNWIRGKANKQRQVVDFQLIHIMTFALEDVTFQQNEYNGCTLTTVACHYNTVYKVET